MENSKYKDAVFSIKAKTKYTIRLIINSICLFVWVLYCLHYTPGDTMIMNMFLCLAFSSVALSFSNGIIESIEFLDSPEENQIRTDNNEELNELKSIDEPEAVLSLKRERFLEWKELLEDVCEKYGFVLSVSGEPNGLLLVLSNTALFEIEINASHLGYYDFELEKDYRHLYILFDMDNKTHLNEIPCSCDTSNGHHENNCDTNEGVFEKSPFPFFKKRQSRL